MSVELKKIPPVESLPVSPNKFSWFVFILVFTMAGAVLVLYLWPEGVSTHSIWFWFCSLIAPFFAGLVIYIIRLRHYENERDKMQWWNNLHQQQYDEYVSRGKQSVGVLGIGYITPLASNKLATAILQGGSQLQTYYSAELQTVLTTALLSPLLTESNEAAYESRLELLLKNTIQQLQPELAQFSHNLCVRIKHDGRLASEQVMHIWERVCPAVIKGCDLDVSTEQDGFMWIDDWLDKQDEALVLSVEFDLFLKACDRQSESVSALLLASPGWLERHHVKPNMWIHRPVVLVDANEAVADVARWGCITPESPWFLWCSQFSPDALAVTLQSMEQSGYLAGKTGEQGLDELFGRPGAAVGNITLLSACEHAVISGQAQWLLVGDKTMQMVIAHPA